MVRVGITGHRFLAAVDKIVAGVDDALGRIERAFAPPLIAISALAEGADCLVAQRVLDRGNARLIVVLPLPAPDYMAEMSSPASREIFLDLFSRAGQVIALPSAPTREESYAAAGHYILDHCDVLLAIWDGRPAQGIGGTAEVVAQARQRHLPLAWVLAGNRRPGAQEPTTLGAEQGQVIIERFDLAGATDREDKL